MSYAPALRPALEDERAEGLGTGTAEPLAVVS
jgi:hypothetical protein